MSQRLGGHVKCLQVRFIRRGARAPITQQALDETGVWKFGSSAKAAECGVKARGKPAAGELNRRNRQNDVERRRRRIQLLKCTHDRRTLLAQHALMLGVILRDALQDLAE